MHQFPLFQNGAAGALVTSGAASAEVAIPNNTDGATARYVRIAATGTCHVKPVATGTAATTNDILVGPGDAVFLNVQGFTHIAYIQQAAASKLVITPVEG
jgi:hypothetical protein